MSDNYVVLVTFTRTLAKYDRYLVELKGLEVPLEVISTASGCWRPISHPSALRSF